jgi:hypothetical protein
MNEFIDMTLADTRVATFAVWTAKGYVHDWDGGVRYCREIENAALFSLDGADDTATRLRGGVVNTETLVLLTLAERLQ